MFSRVASLRSLRSLKTTATSHSRIIPSPSLLRNEFHNFASQNNNNNDNNNNNNNNNIFDSKVMEFFRNESSIVEENKAKARNSPITTSARNSSNTDLKDEEDDLDLETLSYNKTVDSIDDILKVSNNESIINEWNEMVTKDIDNLSKTNGAGKTIGDETQIFEEILNDGNESGNIRDKIKQEKSFLNEVFKSAIAKKTGFDSDTNNNSQIDLLNGLNIDNNTAVGNSGRLFDSLNNRRDPFLDSDKLIEKFVNEQLMLNLKPTVDYINNDLKYDYEVLQFINDSILKNYKFNENIQRRNLLNETKEENSADSTFEYLKVQSLRNPSKPIIDQYSLSYLILICFQKLINDFPNKQLSISNILSIYSQIKKNENVLQSEIFIYGINIEIFNFLIEHSWNHFLDLQLVYSLIFDLKLNGVIQNDETIKIIEKVINESKDLLFENKKRFNRDLTSSDLLKSFFEDYETSRSDIWNEEDNKKYNDINKILLNMISQQ